MPRVEYFMNDDGDGLSLAAGGRLVTVDPVELAHGVLARTRIVPVQFFFGSAQHETNFTLNEYDVEESGAVTYGLFQLNSADKWKRARAPEADFFTLDGQLDIFVPVVEGYLSDILDAVQSYNAAHQLPPIDRDNPPADVWAYLAIAHNQGIGSTSTTKGALGTIAHFGLNWEEYKRRNAGQPWGNVATDRGDGIYGDDVISGGELYRPEYSIPFDASGEAIPAPTVSALASSRLRLVLLAVLLFIIAAAVATRAPLKGVS